MTVYLEWEQEKRIISSIEELDHLLDELTLEAVALSYNFAVDLILESGDALSIVVGEDITHVLFYSPTGRPLVVQATGKWKGEEDRVLIYSYRGSRSEREICDIVPIADGREAMRRFFATGKRPDNITWEG